MQISSEGPAKRSRAKLKDDATAATSAPARKPRKKSKTSSAAPDTAATSATPENVAPAQSAQREPATDIAVTAYFIAAERNFAPGRELDDWLEAERRISEADTP